MKKRVWLKKVEEMKGMTPKEYYQNQFKQIIEEIRTNSQKLFHSKQTLQS